MCNGIDDGFSNGTRKIHDGLQLIVQFYDNFGSLIKVSNKLGIPIQRLRNWLDDDIELSEFDREKLKKSMEK